MILKTIYDRDLLQSGFPVIAHGCNMQGKWGSGLALKIKEKFPEAFKDYKAIHDFRDFKLGEVIETSIPERYGHTTIILSCITQHFYSRTKKVVSYDALALAFEEIEKLYYHMDVAIPMIGAGLGGGNWDIIQNIINVSAPKTNIFVYAGKSPCVSGSTLSSLMTEEQSNSSP